MLRAFWADELGGLICIELILVGTLLVCACGVGLSALNVAVVTELADLGAATAALDQSYSIGGYAGHHASCGGQGFQDLPDSCDDAGCTQAGPASRCVEICIPKQNAGG